MAIFLAFALLPFSFAYFNVTHLTTVVYLSNTTSAKVEETLTVYMSNSSIPYYNTYRSAANQTLSIWGKLLDTNLLTEHILNPKSSIANFTFLPGPAISNGNGATANIQMFYVALNVCNVEEIAPRLFKYTFNDTSFNFEHTASGPALFPNTTLEMVLPKGAKLVAIYPSPDYPVDYKNASALYWFEGEPLNKFVLSYTLTESLQEEVVRFFATLYPKHALLLFIVIFLIILGVIAYIHDRLQK